MGDGLLFDGKHTTYKKGDDGGMVHMTLFYRQKTMDVDSLGVVAMIHFSDGNHTVIRWKS